LVVASLAQKVLLLKQFARLRRFHLAMVLNEYETLTSSLDCRVQLAAVWLPWQGAFQSVTLLPGKDIFRVKGTLGLQHFESRINRRTRGVRPTHHFP
jgi:hypothetical protein